MRATPRVGWAKRSVPTFTAREAEKTVVSMTNIRIPEEAYSVRKFCQGDLPGFATINTALKGFEPKLAFSWHLSLLIKCIDLIDSRLPSADEQNTLYKFEDKLDQLIKANGNALFLARVTHDARRELIWRVHDPEIANSIIQKILSTTDYPRELEYRMEEDQQWQKASWYLNNTTRGTLV
jgi:hypothetical protein